MFGEQWDVSAALLTIFCFGIVVNLLAWFLPSLLISRGYTKETFKNNLIATMFNVILTVVGATFSTQWAVYGLLIASIISLPIRFSLTNKKIPISLYEVFKASLPALVASLVMYLTLVFGYEYLKLDLELVLQLIVKVLIGIVVYIFIWLLFFRKQGQAIVHQLASLRNKRMSH